MFHPVLPYVSNGKLKFPLCARCAGTENQASCQCNNDQRCLTGTWCTPEIIRALSCGYRLIKLYEVYHWNKSSQYDRETGTGGLFSEFVDAFLKIKQEASGWPSWCMTESDKQKYIEEYEAHEKIKLDYGCISYNPARRALAKLILNR